MRNRLSPRVAQQCFPPLFLRTKKSEGNQTISIDTKANVVHLSPMLRYKMLETRLIRQKASLKGKIPDIENTLDLVKMLKERQDEEVACRVWG